MSMTWARWFHDSSGASIKIGKKTKVQLIKLGQSAAFSPNILFDSAEADKPTNKLRRNCRETIFNHGNNIFS